MRQTTFFITGTDTGVGKTVLTALLVRYLHERGHKVAALKPICSGGRDDARALHDAQNSTLTLDEVNPWHFRAPIAPLLAARRERKRVRLGDVFAHIRTLQNRFDVLLVEGAGGLLSPLGLLGDSDPQPSQKLLALTERRCSKNFDSLDLTVALRATPIIVCPNRLGAVNQILLTVKALPRRFQTKVRVVLMSPPEPDAAATSNAKLLSGFLGAKRIFMLPWLGTKSETGRAFQNPAVRRMLRGLVRI